VAVPVTTMAYVPAERLRKEILLSEMPFTPVAINEPTVTPVQEVPAVVQVAVALRRVTWNPLINVSGLKFAFVVNWPVGLIIKSKVSVNAPVELMA